MKGRLAGEPTQIRKKNKKNNKKTTKRKNDTLPQQYIHIYGCIVGDDMLVLVFQNSSFSNARSNVMISAEFLDI